MKEKTTNLDFGDDPCLLSGLVESPPVDLTLDLAAGAVAPPLPNHFGIQVTSRETVDGYRARLREAGLMRSVRTATACCHAVQDKVRAVDPSGLRREPFLVTQADLPGAGTVSANPSGPTANRRRPLCRQVPKPGGIGWRPTPFSMEQTHTFRPSPSKPLGQAGLPQTGPVSVGMGFMMKNRKSRHPSHHREGKP